MQFTLVLELGNDAMQTGMDIYHALRQAAGQVHDAAAGPITREIHTRNLRDENGNTVGYWRIADPPDTRYNGYANYETWSVALFIDNESNEAMADARRASRGRYGALREWFEETFLTDPNTGEPYGNPLVQQFISADMGEVNWYELREHYLSEDDEDADEEAD